MSDFPQAHVTTTTTVTSGTRGRVHFDATSIKTVPGILRIVEIVLSLITFICSVVACTYHSSECGWAGFVSFMAMIVAILWFVWYAFHLHNAITANIPWLLIELIVYAIFVVLLFTAGIALAVLADRASRWYSGNLYGWGYAYNNRGAAGAGAFFAFATMIVFAVHAFFIFREWRANRTITAASNVHGHGVA